MTTNPVSPERCWPGRPVRASDVIADKAWEHLGMTLQEFTVAWYAGWFEQDQRPAVIALDVLMRDGTWDLPAVGASSP